MTDFLTVKRKEIVDRLGELKPLVDEYNRLEAAAAALDGIPTAQVERRVGRPRGSGGTKARGAKAGSARTEASAGKPRGGRRAGRRKGSGARAAEALEVITGQPGIAIPELAAKMGIKQNYLYRVLPALESEGRVKKQGRGWHPTQ